MSETNTPASTSATTPGNETLTLADDVKEYNIEELISFLQEQDLGLDVDDEKLFARRRLPAVTSSR